MKNEQPATISPETLNEWAAAARLDDSQPFAQYTGCLERHNRCPFKEKKGPLCGKCEIAQGDHRLAKGILRRNGFKRSRFYTSQTRMETTASLQGKGYSGQDQVIFSHDGDNDGQIIFSYIPEGVKLIP